MSRLCVWVDDFAIEALPGLVAGLAETGAMVMRSFGRVPNPAMIAQLAEHRQLALVGGRELNQLVARIELAATTLRVGVVAVLPKGLDVGDRLRGPGVVDVLPAATRDVARRVVLMAQVPIVSSGRPRVDAVPLAPLPRARRGEGRAVAIASSTGGCWVLAELLRAAPRQHFPVLLAQHLDGEFIGFFAQWLATTTPWRVEVVEAPTALQPGVVYLATGGKDLCVDRDEHAYAVGSTSRFVPNADRLFSSLAEAFHARATGVVLSGMGSDGAAGLTAIVRAGGRALCQQPGTAIVASMPESALRAVPAATALSPELLGSALLLEATG